MGFKFEKLVVYQLALEYVDQLYEISDSLPKQERYNLQNQLIRAGTSIVLNIAEGSMSHTDAEQIRFIRIAIGSLMETVACQHLIIRRKYLASRRSLMMQASEQSVDLFRKLQALKKYLEAK
ncbi:MAG TPA: four helix bundle protein [bacterium]|nr:four helix bundle protein [bacterium]